MMKLMKTADGVEIVVGMSVWDIDRRLEGVVRSLVDSHNGVISSNHVQTTVWVEWGQLRGMLLYAYAKLYSTHLAALEGWAAVLEASIAESGSQLEQVKVEIAKERG